MRRATQGNLQTRQGTKPALGPRLFHEALVGLPVVRVLRVEFVCSAILLQRGLKVVFVLERIPEAEMSKSVVWVKTECLALFCNHSLPIVLNPKHVAEVGVCIFILGFRRTASWYSATAPSQSLLRASATPRR